jgi:amino acid adenylation domain-containing protein
MNNTLKNLSNAFNDQVDRTPDNIALIYQNEQLTYRQLNTMANRLAQHLKNKGVKPDQFVGLSISPSIEMIVGVLGILKAGASFVPLDPTYPAERLVLMIQDCQANIIITTKSDENQLQIVNQSIGMIYLDELLRDITSSEFYPIEIKPENLALCQYTSGSTGKPKGVLIEHHSIVNHCLAMQSIYEYTPADRILLFAALNHIDAIEQIFTSLLCGACLIIREPELWDVKTFPAKVKQYGITVADLPPGYFHTLLENWKNTPQIIQNLPLRLLILGGEETSAKTVKLWQMSPLNQIRLLNAYGMTEAPVTVTLFEIPKEGIFERMPIGYPVNEWKVHLLDDQQNKVTNEEVGEICISGAGLARSYLNQPELTEKKFIKNPFGKGRLYRTGDIGRFLASGELMYMGRKDNQVQIRGFRVEIEEVEAALLLFPDIQKAAVIASGEEKFKRLLAYIEPTKDSINNQRTMTANIKKSLLKKLPSYMIPDVIIPLKSMPLTPNGKIDRQTLLKSIELRNFFDETVDSILTQKTRKSQSLTEQKIADIWKEILSLDQVDIQSNFFESGGNSLLALELLAKLEQTFQINVSLSQLLNHNTVEQIAMQIDHAKYAPKNTLKSLPQINPDREKRYTAFPLTDIQESYWLGRNETFDLNAPTHFYEEFSGQGLNINHLEKAWNELIKRHDMLRAIILPDGMQQVMESVPTYPVHTYDLSQSDETTIQRHLKTVRKEMLASPISSDQWPLFELRFSILPSQKLHIHLSMDMLIADWGSYEILLEEWCQLYYQPKQPIPELSITFRDYVLAERKIKDTHLYQKSKAYWMDRLSDLPARPELPMTIDSGVASHSGFKRYETSIAPQKWSQLKTQAITLGLTPTVLILTVFSEVLSKWCKQTKFTLNLTLFNRLPLSNQKHINQIVGDFTTLTMLAIDKSHSSETLIEHGKHIQQQLWKDLEHRYFTGIEVLRALAAQQDSIGQSLMPVVFTSGLGVSDRKDNWLGKTVYGLSQTPQVWLDSQVEERNKHLYLCWDVVENLFPPNLMKTMFSTYIDLLCRLSEDETLWQDTNIHLLPESQHQQRKMLNNTQAPISDELLHTLFIKQVRCNPDQLAIIDSHRQMTYGQLFQEASFVAKWLKEHGACKNKLVAVLIEKGWEQVVAVMGTLMAGAAYVPIDPELPKDRQHYLLEQAQIELVLTKPHPEHQLICKKSIQQFTIIKAPEKTYKHPLQIDHHQSPTDLAYVIYTSGSTGQPKWVMIDHQV